MSREDHVFLAELAEMAKRFQEIVEHIHAVARLNVDLTKQERNLLSVGYKNIIGEKIASWRKISTIEQNEEGDDTAIKGFRLKIEGELSDICNGCLLLIQSYLIPRASNDEAIILYLKMKGDCNGYLAEIKDDEEKTKAAEEAKASYEEAIAMAADRLSTTNPVRYELMLSFCDFKFKMLNSPEGKDGKDAQTIVLWSPFTTYVLLMDLDLVHKKWAINRESKFPWKGEVWNIYPSCEKLVCVRSADDIFFLWNPFKRLFKELDPPVSRRSWTTGFGFSSKSKDFKMVCLCMSEKEGFVYSLNDGCWREFSMRELEVVQINEDSASNDGQIYWTSSNRILCFNIDEEIFHYLPQTFCDCTHFPYTIRATEKYVAVLYYPTSEQLEQCVAVWDVNDWAFVFTKEIPHTYELITMWREHLVFLRRGDKCKYIFMHVKDGDSWTTDSPNTSDTWEGTWEGFPFPAKM